MERGSTASSISTTESVVFPKRVGKEKAEIAIQTDTHPIETNKDYSYSWNEWELRRRAVKLVELKNKRTHSTQTTQSHFRRENASQHYAPKTQSTQVGQHSSTNVPTTKRYLTGLRGENPTMKVINVTLDL